MIIESTLDYTFILVKLPQSQYRSVIKGTKYLILVGVQINSNTKFPYVTFTWVELHKIPLDILLVI